MLRTLYGKLAAVLLCLVAFIGLIGMLYALYSEQAFDREVTQRINRNLAANLVASDVLLVDGTINEQALEHVFHSLMVVNPNIEVYLLDVNGTIMAYSAPQGTVVRDRVSVAPIKAYLDGHALPIKGDDPRSLGRTKVFSVSPIMVGDRYEGYLYVVLASQVHDSVVQSLRTSRAKRLGVVALGGALAVALLAGLVLFNLMTRRLRRLSESMATFRDGDFSTPLPEERRIVDATPDEIGELVRTFNQMEERMLQQVQLLRQTDQLRRELIANVSHDLRTPLASIQGYLETMTMNAATLGDEQRQHYLAVASKNARRLATLVEELFELARLESKEMQVEIEPFPIAELVQDVVQDFQLRASDSGITLEASLPQGTPLVAADIGLIQRALQNLIANALRHTQSGGRVAIAVEARERLVVVRVEDTGCGIPQHELEQVFERFYQADSGSSGGSAGGLGLAIVKKILELHGSAVEASSTVGEGTSFWFSLPVAS